MQSEVQKDRILKCKRLLDLDRLAKPEIRSVTVVTHPHAGVWPRLYGIASTV